MTTTNARPKRDRATIGKSLIAKAYDGFRPLPYYFEKGSGEAVVQTLNVNVINTARAVLVAHGYGYKPSAAARTFTKRFVDTGEFPGRFGALLKTLAHLDHEADFAPFQALDLHNVAGQTVGKSGTGAQHGDSNHKFPLLRPLYP